MKMKPPARGASNLTMFEFVSERYNENLPALLEDLAAYITVNDIEDHNIWSLDIISNAPMVRGESVIQWSAQLFVADAA